MEEVEVMEGGGLEEVEVMAEVGAHGGDGGDGGGGSFNSVRIRVYKI